jgi:DNA-directed RNA polymerase II subunit RPB2
VPRTRFHTLLDLKDVLANDLFPNMGPSASAKKAGMLARIVRRLVRTAMGKEPLSELDDYTNKRLQVSGDFVSDSFRNAFYRTGVAAVNALNVEFDVGAWRVTNDILTLLTEANLKSVFQTYILKDALRLVLKGRSKIVESEDPNTPVQALSRVSYLSYVSHMRRVNNPVDRTVKMVSPHVLRASHWGIVCPIESPDGPNIGLLTHLSSCCIVSSVISDDAIMPLISKSMVGEEEGGGIGKTDIFLNDTWIGICDDPETLLNSIKSLRLKRETRTVGVSWDMHRNMLYVRTDRGRCCRPLIKLPVKSIPKSASFDDMLDSGAIEFVDVEEVATNCLIAMQHADMKRYPLNKYTHLEPHAGASLSIVAGTFPMLHHNSSTKSVLSMAQFKQALGISLTSQRARMDTDAYELNYAQCPLVTTSMANRLFGGRMAHGENLIVAICCYTGYNQEDGVILNMDSVQRGRLNVTTLSVHRFEEEKNDESSTIFANPPLLASRGYKITGNVEQRFDSLDERGLPLLQSFIRPGDVMLGMIHESSTSSKGDVEPSLTSSVRRLDGMGHALGSFVDGVSVQPYDRDLSRCKVRLRQTRIPELGDKLASRFGQKGVVGMLLPAVDMPFCAEDGIVPDILINPNAFPSRMTVAHLLETLLAPESARDGTRFCADTFGGDLDSMMDRLNMQNMGDTVMHSGRGGELIDTRIFVGINYYGRLRHMVEDKYQWRCTGPVDVSTRQPAKGAGGMSGGLRVGEMEQNAIMAHGLSGFMKESFMERSDSCRINISDETGAPTGRWDHPNIWRVDPECPRDVHSVDVPFAFKLLQQELQTMSIDSKLICE